MKQHSLAFHWALLHGMPESWRQIESPTACALWRFVSGVDRTGGQAIRTWQSIIVIIAMMAIAEDASGNRGSWQATVTESATLTNRVREAIC